HIRRRGGGTCAAGGRGAQPRANARTWWRGGLLDRGWVPGNSRGQEARRMVHMDGGMAKRFLMLGLVAALAAALFGPGAWTQEAAGRRPLTEEEGRLVAQAALAYAEVEYWAGGALRKGMPYLWGGRTTVEQLLAAAAQAAED